MKMIKNLVSKINYCHIIWFFFFLILLIFTIPEAVNIGQRIINSFICFGKNMWIYFYFIFVGDYPDIAINGSWMFIDTNSDIINGILPIEFEYFLEQLIAIITLPFNGLIFNYWWNQVFNKILIIFRFSTLILLIGLEIYILFQQYFSPREFDKAKMDVETKPKRIFIKVAKPFKIAFNYLINKIKQFNEWTRNHSYLLKIFLVILLLRIHIIPLLIESISFILAFICLFDFKSLWYQILAIIIDLLPTIKLLPLWIWILIVIGLIYYHWIKKADEEIIHQQMILKLLVKNEFGSTNFIVGKPGAGKDLLGTELTLVAESTLRYDLRKVLLEIRSEYPDFPFASFEHHLQDLIKKKKIVNWTQAKNYVYLQANKIMNKKNKEDAKFFGYELFKKKNSYYDELTNSVIFDAIADYAHAYFMYIQSGVLAASNYPIRFDNIKIDTGHFVNYDDIFIFHNNREMDDFSTYSKINNYDWQRIYKKVQEDEYSFLDDGVVLALSEYAKERGNQLDHRGMKIIDEDINQLNDGTNSFWKTKSHINVIRGKRYGQAFINDQREDSLNADNKEIFEYIWNIQNRSEPKSVLHGFWYSRMLLEFFSSFISNLYEKLVSVRSDDALLFYIIKKLNTGLNTLNRRINNRWNISNISLKNQYDHEINVPLIHKLIYANRYNTSVYGSMYESIYIKNKVGFYQAPEYESTTATVDEFEYQNSYFINKFYFKNKTFKEQEETPEDAI